MVKTIKYLLGIKRHIKVLSQFDDGRPKSIQYSNIDAYPIIAMFKYEETIIENKSIKYEINGECFDLKNDKVIKVSKKFNRYSDADNYYTELIKKYPTSTLNFIESSQNRMKKYC
jgi:hypothetical protein